MGITLGSFRVGCDNLLSVHRCKGGVKFPTRVSHYDIIRCIIRLPVVHDLPITVALFRVYGHQDNDVEYAKLSRDAQPNVICDLNTKAYLQEQITSNAPAHMSFPDERCAISINNTRATTDVG